MSLMSGGELLPEVEKSTERRHLMDTIASQVTAAAVYAIAQMISRADEVAADLFGPATADPAQARRDYAATVRALSAHPGSGNRVVVTFPTDTPGGRAHGHMLATAILDQAASKVDGLPDTAVITDHNGMSVLAW
jgi:hypothetical protein